MILSFGVIDVPYADSSYRPVTRKQSATQRVGAARRGNAAAPATSSQHMTTGDVAEILEAKYHIMETFYELHEDEIDDLLANSIGDAIETLWTTNGESQGNDPTLQGTGDIESKFKDFLSMRGMDATATPGVPTMAAMKGVNHRMLHPYAKRGSRPSFIDTGLYQSSIKVQVLDQ